MILSLPPLPPPFSSEQSGSNIVHTAGRRSVPALVTCAAAIGSPMATSTLVGTADGFLDTVLLGTGMASVAASSPLSNHPIGACSRWALGAIRRLDQLRALKACCVSPSPHLPELPVCLPAADIVAQTRAHYAGISAISIRPSRLKAFQSKLAHRVRSSALALSCSFDGTVKIWDVEVRARVVLCLCKWQPPQALKDEGQVPCYRPVVQTHKYHCDGTECIRMLQVFLDALIYSLYSPPIYS